MSRPLVYISSAYTLGDPCINTRFQAEVFQSLLESGLVLPFAPLVGSHTQQMIHPLSHREWLDYDLGLIRSGAFDVCLRLVSVGKDGYSQHESKGAEAEVSLFKEMELPVFFDLTSLYQWAMAHYPQ